MTAEIKRLEVVPPAVDPDVVNFLESELAAAKRGEITGILILSQNPNGTASYTITGIQDRFTQAGYLYAALHRLQYDVRQ